MKQVMFSNLLTPHSLAVVCQPPPSLSLQQSQAMEAVVRDKTLSSTSCFYCAHVLQHWKTSNTQELPPLSLFLSISPFCLKEVHVEGPTGKISPTTIEERKNTQRSFDVTPRPEGWRRGKKQPHDKRVWKTIAALERICITAVIWGMNERPEEKKKQSGAEDRQSDSTTTVDQTSANSAEGV